MRSPASVTAALALAFAAVPLAACGSDDGNPGGPDAGEVACSTPTAMRLQPLVAGATWTYSVTEPGHPIEQKASTIEMYEDIGDRKAGTFGWRQKTEKLNGVSVSWSEDRCTSIVRHREKSYDMTMVLVSDQFYTPSKLRIDETPAHLAAGATWVVSYTEVEVNPTTMMATSVTKDENWSVVSANEMLMVPAGTFETVHLHKLTSGAAQKDYWYAKGVGKIKETGEQTEVLTAYTIP